MTERQGKLAGTTGARAIVLYNEDGTWKGVQGLGQMQINPGQAQSSTYSAFEGSFSTTGAEEIGTVSFEINSFMANHPSWKYIAAQRKARANIQLRVESQEQVIYNANEGSMIALTNAGVVTLSGNGGSKKTDLVDAARGHAFKTAAKLLTIRSISDAADPVIKCEIQRDGAGAAEALNATAWTQIVVPILRWNISGKIATFGGATLQEDAAISGQLVVQPTSAIELPMMQLTHTAAE